MSNERDRYKATTLRILGSFQMLEFMLKVYISFAYKIISRSVLNVVPFNYQGSDVENYPLEKLLNVFSKLNANVELISRLNKLRSDRNYIAHNSLLVSMARDCDIEALKENEEAFFYIEDEIVECLNTLITETRVRKNFTSQYSNLVA